uniref:Cilia- and flagella-associated protein 58 central coiled coil domain-containing protein n=1 Tax=Phaeomonas parva TaxID=124430 RepID=A0A7S1U464_9STRA|mmetsp:Transcript_30225/g.96413  ORF Transcript_30225/g.96413 Transcript_30225/m.96413 type:complete len:936 (+) Transcript_30225:67-2874(+)
MATVDDPLEGQDLEGSIAYSLLTDLENSKKVSKSDGELYRQRYAELYKAVLAVREREILLLKRAKAINNEVLGEKVALEKAKVRHQGEAARLRNLEQEQNAAQKAVDEEETKYTVAKYKVAELSKNLEELASQSELIKAENEALVNPELQALADQLEQTKVEHQRLEEAYDADMRQKEQLVEMHDRLEASVEESTRDVKDLHAQAQKAAMEPKRIHKQAETVAKAVESLDGELRRIQERSQACEDEIQRQNTKRSESEEVRENLQRKLALHRDTIEHRQQEVDALDAALDAERARQHELNTLRVDTELRARTAEENNRHENDKLNIAKKELELARRKLRKKRAIADSVREVLPQLEATVKENEQMLRSYKDENTALRKEQEETKAEVDILIARFLQQESIEQNKRSELDALVEEVDGLEETLAKWHAEERKQNKILSVLSAQRELRSREALRAKASEKDTREQVRIKELVILDLTKKCNEVNNRLKEFSALYDVVKNERNKYVNLIQSSNQAQAEMREKIRILQNEVDILLAESGAKDRALQKEHAARQAAQTQRDALRLDTNKAQAEYRRQQEKVEQQIVEIDKLNSIINSLEGDMLRLKRQFEDAVEARNMTGVQLIDRNDELCILYEKANLQEETLKRGEIALSEKEEEIRLLRLQSKEIERQNEVARKQSSSLPELSDKVVALSQELSLEKSITDELCAALEDPGNTERWRGLEGEDPDVEQLASKIKVLEDRLNEKREALLEKDLVLEEVSTLTEKLRSQANAGKAEAVALAKQINEFQARIRDVTRRMMATVSELSMHQATAMKLQAEKARSMNELDEAKFRVEHGQAPTEDAERTLYRLERDRLTAKSMAMMDQSNMAIPGSMQQPNNILRSTAEARPNAYIPDGINQPARQPDGIPRPYGGFAPFKPQEAGTTMRHIRQPEPKEIEI